MTWRSALAAILCSSGLAVAAPRTYRNDAMRVQMSIPSGWEAAPQSTYPRLLAAYTHPSGGKLTLTAQRVSTQSAVQLAESSRDALSKQGFVNIKISQQGDRVRLDAQLDQGKRLARQLYVVDRELGYVLTGVVPASSANTLLRDFDECALTLTVGGGRDGGTP